MNKKQNYHSRYSQFYNSKEWHDLRNFKWQESNGLCEMCLKENIIRKGREVHHIIPIEKDWSKRLDYENLILLCPDHHNEAHERVSPLSQFLNEFEKS